MIQFLSVLTIISAAQSILLFVHFLIKKKGVKILNRLLALLTFGFSLLLINTYLNLNGFEFTANLHQDLSNNIMWFLGPALYLYTIYDKEIDRKKVYIHIIPFIIPFILDVFFSWPIYDSIIPFAAYIQMCFYLSLALIFCIKNYKYQKKFFSWILPSIVTFLIVVVINFGLTILSLFDVFLIPNYLQLCLVLLFSFPIFFISYKEMNSDNSYGLVTKKYKTSPISTLKAEEYLKTIMVAIEENEMFRDMNLTLASFSKDIQIPSKYISQVINEKMRMSFPDFINQYRIEDVKKALVNAKNKDFTILAIAQDSGFKSGSRFNTLFKKHTGLTPTSYRKKHLH